MRTFSAKFSTTLAGRAIEAAPADFGEVTWLDDRRALFFSAPGLMFLLDLDKQKVQVVSPDNTLITLNSLVPGGRFADVNIVNTSGQPAAEAGMTRALISTQASPSKSLSMPLELGTQVTWLNEGLGLFTRSDGGLSGIGTWLLNAQSGETRRLTNKLSRDARLVGKDDVKLVLRIEGEGVIAVPLSGEGTPVRLAEDGDIHTLHPAVDLGLADDSTPADQLWQPVDYTGLAKAEQAEQPAAEPADPESLLGVLEALADESATVQKEAEGIYNALTGNSAITRYYSVAKVTLLLVEARKSNPNMSLNGLMTQVDLGSALDRQRVIDTTFEQTAPLADSLVRQVARDRNLGTLSRSQRRQLLEDVVKPQRMWIAEQTADKLFETPKLAGNANAVSQLMQVAMQELRTKLKADPEFIATWQASRGSEK